MEFELKEYETIDGEQILYVGNVDFQKLELLSKRAMPNITYSFR